MMVELSAVPAQPGTGPGDDQQLFYRLAALATQTGAIEPLLSALAKELTVPALSISAPEDTSEPQSDAHGQVSVPIRYRGRLLGQLCAAAAPDADRDELAARMAFFSPAMALQLVINMRCQDELAASPRTDFLARDLRDERDRLEAVLDATNDAILLVDTHEMLAMATPQLEAITGISRYDILGLPVTDLTQRSGDQPSLPPAMTNVIRALAGNYTESLGGEFEVAEPQRRTLVWYSLPVYVRSGALLGRIYAFRDATRERELDRMKTEFVSLVSHELRTPLTTIRLAADMINDQRQEFDPATARAAELLLAQVQRFETLLGDLLEISRYDAGSVQLELEPTSLTHLAEDVIASMAQLAEQHGSDVRLLAPGGYSPVEMDPRRVRRIVRNLLGNAIEHGEGRPIVVTVDSDQQAVALGVRDFGLGMNPEDVERVFDRFWRADPSRKRTIGGTGLGMSIALGDARLHGGTLAVWSELGRGTNVVLTLPRRGRQLGGTSPVPLEPDAGAALDDLGRTQPIEVLGVRPGEGGAV